MWKIIKDKILQPVKAAGLEIVLAGENDWHLNGSIAELKKNSIVKTDAFVCRSVEEFSKKVTDKLPVAIVLNGRGIIVKKVMLSKPGSITLVDVLPNANPSEFYFYADVYEGFAIAHIARKELIDRIVSIMTTNKVTILQLHFGFSPLQKLYSFIKYEGQTIETTLYTLQFDHDGHLQNHILRDNAITDQFGWQELCIADQYISSQQLIAFSAAADFLVSGTSGVSPTDIPQIIHAKKSFIHNKKVKAYLMGFTIFVFTILLLNFFIFSHYHNNNKELQIKQTFLNENLQAGEELQNRISRKEDLLSHYHWDKPARLSYYADRIASLTPPNTLLTTMSIFPLRQSSAAEQIYFKNDTILLAGICDDPVELNEMQAGLKIVPGFRQVSIKSYAFRKESEKGSFTIEIIIE
jgi:hypothetical protein